MQAALILMATDVATYQQDQKLLWTPIAGHSSVARILIACEVSAALDAIIILVDVPYLARAQALVTELELKTPIAILPASTDHLSTLSSALDTLKTLAPDLQYVAIHDAYRPLLTPELLQAGLVAAKQHSAVCAAVPVKDTIKQVEDGMIQATLERSQLWQLQSPQVFAIDLLTEALHSSEAQSGYSDEASLLTQLGKTITIFPGSYNNLRLCGPADLLLAEALLQGK